MRKSSVNLKWIKKSGMVVVIRSRINAAKKEKPHWLSAGKAGPGNRKEAAGLPLPSLWFQPRNPTLAGKRRLGLMERHPNHSLFCQTVKGPLCFIYAFLFLLSQLIFAFGITISLITC